jgi:S-DNA-T family DNA segregation ATPase FtsK/SpoIIIE
MTDALWVLVLTVAALVVVRRRLPVLFWWLIGYPAVTLRVLTSYRATMDACGLTVPASAVRRATARMMGRQAAPVPPRRSLPRRVRPRDAAANGGRAGA